MTICSYHVTYTFQSEFTLYGRLNVKELLTRNRREIWSLSDCNWTRTHNHLVCKWTLNHLAKLAQWLSCVVSTYMYGAFDYLFLSCHVRVSDWMHTLWLPECLGTLCSKQARNLNFKWLSLNLNPQPLSFLTDERRLALFPAKVTVTDPHHRESPTRRDQGLNLHGTWVQA